MTGDGVHDHHSRTAFLHESFFEICHGHLLMRCHSVGISGADVDHKLPAASTTRRAVNLRSYLVIKRAYQLIHYMTFLVLKEYPEAIVFFQALFGQQCDHGAVRLKRNGIWQFLFAKVGYLRNYLITPVSKRIY